MIQTFTLIVIICQSGAWSGCSGGNREIRVDALVGHIDVDLNERLLPENE